MSLDRELRRRQRDALIETDDQSLIDHLGLRYGQKKTWPVRLTGNRDIGSYVFESRISKILEGDDLHLPIHEAVAIELKNWLESEGGICDADLITNTDVYKPAAANYFASKILANMDSNLSRQYLQCYRRLRREARPRLRGNLSDGIEVVKIIRPSP